MRIPRTTEGYLLASLLPQHTRKSQGSVSSDISVAESTISQVSLYQKFARADTEEDFELIQQELIIEWKWAIGIVSPSPDLNFTCFNIVCSDARSDGSRECVLRFDGHDRRHMDARLDRYFILFG